MVERVKERTLEGQQHQEIPFEQVVEMVQPVRSLGHTPIFQVMFAWQNAPAGTLELPGLKLMPIAVEQDTAQFDLSVSLQEEGERIVGGVVYAKALFERETVMRYVRYWRALLEGMVGDERQAVDRLMLLGEAERHQVVEEWNATEAAYPKDRCVHELFEEQVEKSAEAVAVVYEEQQVSYGELNRRANQLAHHLRRLGVGPETRVAICVERSVEMVIGLMGVLKAGGAYVPLDPAYPTERLAYMLEDSAPAVVLTHGAADGAAGSYWSSAWWIWMPRLRRLGEANASEPGAE